MKAGKKFLNLITYTDIFGDAIEFTINKERTPKTLIGGVLTTTLLLLMTILFCFQIRDPLGKLYPIISSFIDVKPQVGEMNFDKTNMAFAFSITDDDGNFYDEDLYLNIGIREYKVESAKWSETYNKLELVKCTKDYFPKIQETEFLTFGLRNYYCIKDQNVTISGYQNGINYSSLSFHANFCKYEIVDDEEVLLDDCDPVAQREKLRNKTSIYVSLYFVNNIFNAKSYSNSKESYIENIFSYLDIDKIKYTVLNFNRQNLITDDGLIWYVEKTDTLISLEGYRIESISKDFDPNLLARINVHPSNKEYTSIRAYNKITTVMAEVRGLFEYIRIPLKLFCVVFVNSKKNLIIMNSLFEFDMNDRDAIIKRNSKINKSLKHFNISKQTDNKVLNGFKESNDNSHKYKNSKLMINNQNNINETIRTNTVSEENPYNNKIRNFKDLFKKSDVMINTTLVNLKNDLEPSQIEYDQKSQKNQEVRLITTPANLDTNINNKKFPRIYEENLKYNFNYKADFNSVNNISKDNNLDTFRNVNGIDNLNSKSEIKYIYAMSRVKPKEKEFKDYYSLRRDLTKKKKISFTNKEKIKINLFAKCIKDKQLRKKYDLFQTAKEKMSDMFEITYVMGKLEEIEKLKAILLNKHQVALFDMLMREPCSLNPDVLRHHQYNQFKEYQFDSGRSNSEIQNFKNKIKNNRDELNDVDERLFDLLPCEMKEIILIK